MEVSVEDQGVGMTREEVHNIFTPFHKSLNQRRIMGNGVGLSICKQICQKLDGDITAKSVQTKGSTFTFTMRVFLVTLAKHKILKSDVKQRLMSI